MGFGDKLKDIRTKAQQSVAEHAEQITNAVESVGLVANEKTKGKYATKIQKLGDKTTGAVGKFAGGAEDASEETESAAAPVAAQETEAPQATEATEAAQATEATEAASGAPATPAATQDPGYQPPSFE